MVEKSVLLDNLCMERALLGALLLDNNLIDTIPDSFRANHLSNNLHRDIYTGIENLLKKGLVADPIILDQVLNSNEEFKNNGGKNFLISLVNDVIGFNVASYATQLTDLYLRREINKICINIKDDANTKFEETQAIDLIDKAEQELYKLSNLHLGGQIVHIKTPLNKVIQTAKESVKSNKYISGVTSGFRDIDQCLGGFNKSDLIILAGRPSMGKTALALNIAFNSAKAKLHNIKEGTGVAFFSLEMSAEQLATRLLSSATKIPARDIIHGKLNQDDVNTLSQHYQEIEDIELYIDETPSITSRQIKHQIRKLQLKSDIGLVIIDYLQLMASDIKSNNRVQEISSITRELKNIAKDLNIPIIALSQLSRAVEQREDKRPQLADLRDSGSIEQDADIVMFVYREAYYKRRQEPKINTSDHDKWQEEMSKINNRAEVIIAKHRNGSIANLHLFFNPILTKFGNLKENEILI